MTKLLFEYIRLIIAFVFFVCLVVLLFMHINQVKALWINNVAEFFVIISIVVNSIIPIWLVVDLLRKKVADKTLFNLTFFICFVSILLLFFTLTFL